jgi:predicted N-acyltransferase
MNVTDFRYALSDSITFLDPDHWDHVATNSGQFMSRKFLQILERHLPVNLSTHYAIIFEGERPVATVVAQSLDIRVADLSGARTPEEISGFWHSLGEASQRSISRARKQILLYDDFLLWPIHAEAEPEADPGELWPGVASDLWHRFRHLFHTAEQLVESSVAWVHMRFLVCGNLLSTGPHGVAFAEGQDPSKLWPAVLEALNRIQISSRLSGESDMLMIKDLTDEHAGAKTVLRRAGFRRFETEPNMVLHLKPSWATFDDLLQDMRSGYRSGIRKVLKDLEDSEIQIERLDPEHVEVEASEIHRLYHQVHDHQKLRLTAITKEWIPALASAYQDDFRTVVARQKESGQMLGFITLIRDADSVFGSYIGFEKSSAAKGLPLYTALVYSGVAQAIEMRASHIILGRTALSPKAQIGAQPQPMHGYLRHRSPFLNLAVPSVLALLPAPERSPERHPFKG